MIRIRPEQVAVLRSATHATFVERLLPHLRKTGEGREDGELRDCARAAIAAAARWGLATEVELYRLAVLHVRLGVHFEQQPPDDAVAHVVREPSLDAHSRLAWLEQLAAGG